MTDVLVQPEPLPPVPSVVSGPTSERSQARRETLKLLLRRPAFLIGCVDHDRLGHHRAPG